MRTRYTPVSLKLPDSERSTCLNHADEFVLDSVLMTHSRTVSCLARTLVHSLANRSFVNERSVHGQSVQSSSFTLQVEMELNNSALNIEHIRPVPFYRNGQ